MKVVEKIDVQVEIKKLMQIPTYNPLPDEWKKGLHRMPLIEIFQRPKTDFALIMDKGMKQYKHELQCICWDQTVEGVLLRCSICRRL